MTDWMDDLPAQLRGRVRASPAPGWIVPMAATLTKERFDSPDWAFEKKLDGIRYLSFVAGGSVRMLTRNRLQHRHPRIEEALAAQRSEDFVVDGEMVAFVGERSGFGLRGEKDARVEYHVFDVLRVDGYDVTRLPLTERRKILERRFTWRRPLVRVESLAEDGLAAYERACAEGWEGVIAKRLDGEYEHRRSSVWLKMKCEATQELVVGGYTDPRGSRESLGALLVGHYEGDDLVFAGKVGTGFGRDKLRDLRARLDPLEVDEPPFTKGSGMPRKAAHWVRPELVVQVGFMEWTGDGKLRHPRYLGIRDDKPPRDVVRES